MEANGTSRSPEVTPEAQVETVNLYERFRTYVRTRDGTTVFFIILGVFSLILLQLFLAICQFYYRRTLNRNLEMRGLLETTPSQQRPQTLPTSRVQEERSSRVSPIINRSGTVLVEVHELTHMNYEL